MSAGAPKLTTAQSKALAVAAKDPNGLWVPEGSGQHQMAHRLVDLGLGSHERGMWGAIFAINAAGRAAIARKP